MWEGLEEGKLQRMNEDCHGLQGGAEVPQAWRKFHTQEQFMQRFYLLKGLQSDITGKRWKEARTLFPPQPSPGKLDLCLGFTFLVLQTRFDVDDSALRASAGGPWVCPAPLKTHLGWSAGISRQGGQTGGNHPPTKIVFIVQTCSLSNFEVP